MCQLMEMRYIWIFSSKDVTQLRKKNRKSFMCFPWCPPLQYHYPDWRRSSGLVLIWLIFHFFNSFVQCSEEKEEVYQFLDNTWRNWQDPKSWHISNENHISLTTELFVRYCLGNWNNCNHIKGQNLSANLSAIIYALVLYS